MPRKVLVCGGRDYANVEYPTLILDATHKSDPISLLIHGAARGADFLAGDWAKANKVPLKMFPADWGGQGKAAGPIRNLKMLAEGKPDLVIAFPGGKGTAHMKRVAAAHGVQVVAVPSFGKEVDTRPRGGALIPDRAVPLKTT